MDHRDHSNRNFLIYAAELNNIPALSEALRGGASVHIPYIDSHREATFRIRKKLFFYQKTIENPSTEVKEFIQANTKTWKLLAASGMQCKAALTVSSLNDNQAWLLPEIEDYQDVNDGTSLWSLVRCTCAAIRRHLIEKCICTNLFCAVPKLSLPAKLNSLLLYHWLTYQTVVH